MTNLYLTGKTKINNAIKIAQEKAKILLPKN